jgi:glycerol-3-phosphate dehydrogenase
MTTLEPRALEDEISFILRTAGKYLTRQPKRQDVLSVFAGLRPLAANPDDPAKTREISRRHKITISPSGLITIEGGKWTIYRKMAQDTLNKAMHAGLLEKRPCRTHHLPVHGFALTNGGDHLRIYGSHAREIREMVAGHPEWARVIHPGLPYIEAEFRWICRNEMPRKLEDVLARRTRALFLNASASRQMADEVAGIMAEEMGWDDIWIKNEIEEYASLVENYIC